MYINTIKNLYRDYGLEYVDHHEDLAHNKVFAEFVTRYGRKVTRLVRKDRSGNSYVYIFGAKRYF